MAITSYSLGIFIILSCRLVHKCNALEMGAAGGEKPWKLNYSICVFRRDTFDSACCCYVIQ